MFVYICYGMCMYVHMCMRMVNGRVYVCVCVREFIVHVHVSVCVYVCIGQRSTSVAILQELNLYF